MWKKYVELHANLIGRFFNSVSFFKVAVEIDLFIDVICYLSSIAFQFLDDHDLLVFLVYYCLDFLKFDY